MTIGRPRNRDRNPKLTKLLPAFRQERSFSIHQASAHVVVSSPTWRDAELFGIASPLTLRKLAAAGIDVGELPGAVSSKRNGRVRTTDATAA